MHNIRGKADQSARVVVNIHTRKEREEIERAARRGRGEKDEQDVRSLREDGLSDRGAQMPRQDMAQAMFQVPGLRYDPEYANIQRFQQTAIL